MSEFLAPESPQIKTRIGVLRTSEHCPIAGNKFKDFTGLGKFSLVRRTPILVFIQQFTNCNSITYN